MDETSTEAPSAHGTSGGLYPGWTVQLHTERTSSLRLGVLVVAAPLEKSTVAVVTGRSRGRPLDVVSGLRWSAGMRAFYSYLPARQGWRSDWIEFAAPVESVEVQLLSWPTRERFDPGGVRRLFVETKREFRQPSAHSLHFARRPAR
jgi:hypothetical protein